MISKFPEVLNFNRSFLELNRFICNYMPILPGYWSIVSRSNRLGIISEWVSHWDLSSFRAHLEMSMGTLRPMITVCMQCVVHIVLDYLDFLVCHTSDFPRSTSADWFLVKLMLMSLGTLMDFDSPCMISLVEERRAESHQEYPEQTLQEWESC